MSDKIQQLLDLLNEVQSDGELSLFGHVTVTRVDPSGLCSTKSGEIEQRGTGMWEYRDYP